MTDWLQKMLDGDVSAASSDGYKVGDVVQFLGGPHYKASTDKRQTEHQRLARPRSPSSSRARCTRTMLFTRTERPGSMAGSMPARSPVNLAAVLPAAVKVA